MLVTLESFVDAFIHIYYVNLSLSFSSIASLFLIAQKYAFAIG